MKKEANEVMYKMAEYLLKKMQENGLISGEEREKIRTLNIETFSPELAVYVADRDIRTPENTGKGEKIWQKKSQS